MADAIVVETEVLVIGSGIAGLSFAMEGGHSRRRIAFHGDSTGRAIESALIRAVESTPNIDVLEDHVAVDLLVASRPGPDSPRCVGAIEARARSCVAWTGFRS